MNFNTGLVSIVMTSYNYGRYIERAINSVLQQNYNDWELIVVDDGSSDDSLQIIKKYAKDYPDKIQLHIHPDNQNLGLQKSLELAFENVRGEFISFLETDDFWDKDNLSEKIHVFRKYPDLSLVYSDFDFLFEADVPKEKFLSFRDYSKYVGFITHNKPFEPFRYILERNPLVSFSNLMIKREVISQIVLNKKFEVWSDWWVILHASFYGKFYYIKKKLFTWRVHSKSLNTIYQLENDARINMILFKLDMINLIRDNYLKTGNSKFIDVYYNYQLDLLSIYRRFRHFLGFILYSPRTLFFFWKTLNKS